MLADSNLLADLNPYALSPAGRPLCIYGDPAYPLRVNLQSPFRNAVLTAQMEVYSEAMSFVWSSVEWLFGDIVNYFKFLDFQKSLKFGFELSRENAYSKKTKLASSKHFHDRCFLTYLNVGKWMEIRYCHTPFSKNFNKPVDHFLFLLAVLPYR